MNNTLGRSAIRVSIISSIFIILIIFLLLKATQTYFRIDDRAYIRREELQENRNISSDKIKSEKIPRIIHQTWKDANLPQQWQKLRNDCMEMHQNFEYMFWTDADSRQFIMDNYKWFLPIFDSYSFNIQRADAIRYFVLHKYGGIYMDLDVGCLRKLDPLLSYEVILPETIPVGVSNDVMASTESHPFMDYLIHNLGNFNLNYLANYPTVMFSTGPMFVTLSYISFQERRTNDFTGIRILPKHLYGKNIDPSKAKYSFFHHLYGSSWHANDASSFIFLRDYGRIFLASILVALSLYVFITRFKHILILINTQLEQRRLTALSNINEDFLIPSKISQVLINAFKSTLSIIWRNIHWINLAFRGKQPRRHNWKPIWFEIYRPFLMWIIVTLCSTLILILFRKEVSRELESFSIYLRGLGPIGVLIFGLFIVLTTIPPMPLYSTSIVLCGYTFGMLQGFAIAYTFALLGAILVFKISRNCLKMHLYRLRKQSKQLSRLIQVVERRPRLLFLVRLAPYPYNILNAILASSQELTLKTYALCTALSLPKLLIHCALGSSIKDFTNFSGISFTQITRTDKVNEISREERTANVLYTLVGVVLFVGVSVYLIRLVRKAIDKELEEEYSLLEGMETTAEENCTALDNLETEEIVQY